MSLTLNDYMNRRTILMQKVAKGIILISANQVLPRNYLANSLPFRQDSTFLYYTGINIPDLFVAMDCEKGETFLAGNEPVIEDAIWNGIQKNLLELAETSGIVHTLSMNELKDKIGKYNIEKNGVHYLPPYTAQRKNILSELLGKTPEEIVAKVSVALSKAVIDQRSVKSEVEISEIEMVLNQVTGPMHEMVMTMAVEGNFEYQIVAEMYKAAKAHDLEFAYPVICSVHGEILHNETHQNRLKDGQLLLVDAGVESQNHYSSDITRTTPVGGKFSRQQLEIYQIVLEAQIKAIENIKPGITYREIHLNTARNITSRLTELGLMKGDTEEAVHAGAHALFFPHGLGHMLGLDVHDMEDLGEDLVGYDKTIKRSKQFGTAYLRLAKKLKPGYVLTVEPGIYFIPVLIDQWRKQKLFDQYINYTLLDKYLDFGGIRIEDNVQVTETGHKILGNRIIKTVEEIEALF